jgi:hypothetical protein
MAISSEQIYLLNNRFGKLANFVQLGTLVQNAETSAPADASVTTAKLADGSVTTAKLADVNVTTAKIADANVTLAKLAAGITPSHVVVKAGTLATTAGSATCDITVSGLLTTDVPSVGIKTVGGTPRTIVSYTVPSNGTLRVVFSGDPSTDHVLWYNVVRAAS